MVVGLFAAGYVGSLEEMDIRRPIYRVERVNGKISEVYSLRSGL